MDGSIWPLILRTIQLTVLLLKRVSLMDSVLNAWRCTRVIRSRCGSGVFGERLGRNHSVVGYSRARAAA